MKILYVVDHPSRDLPSYSWWTIDSGFHYSEDSVALISMNDINRDIISKELFDIIIWNYARPNNMSLIKASSHLGTYNIIHDTEGIPYDISSYYSNLKASDFLFVNEIWTWGEFQSEHLQKRFVKEGICTLVKNTGSIRYAFANQLPKVNLLSNNTVLWNTNFPLLAPKYNTLEREFTELHHKHLQPLAHCLDRLRIASECRIYAIYKSIDIARELSSLNILLRTHPFEAKDYYQGLIKDVGIAISGDRDVNEDLSSSRFVLHSGCQTSLDAYFRGVPSFVFDHSSDNIWATTSCRLPVDLSNLMDATFLYDSLGRQKKLYSENNLQIYLSNLDCTYDYLRYFTLENIVLPSRKFCLFWKFVFSVMTHTRRVRCFLSGLSQHSWLKVKNFALKKLSSSGISTYVENTYNIRPHIVHNCVYVTPRAHR